MDKLLVLLHATLPDGLRRALVSARPRLGATRVTLSLADDRAHAPRVTFGELPAEEGMLGLLSVWGPVESRALLDTLAPAASVLGAYRVDEDVPLPGADRFGPVGPDPSPTDGVNVVAFLKRPARLTHDAWLEHWRTVQVPTAIETQSSFRYVRNIVTEALTPGAPAFDGIVEEGFGLDAAHDRALWYRDGETGHDHVENAKRMMRSVRAFLDPADVVARPMSEYRLYDADR